MNPCEKCKSGFFPFCKNFCRAYKMATIKHGRRTAYQQQLDSIAKAVKRG